MKLIEVLESSIPTLPSGETNPPLYLRMTFKQKPRRELHELLSDLGAASNLDSVLDVNFVRAERGSYIEVVSTTLITVVMLQVFLFLINGCVIQLTELKFRLKLLSRGEAPKYYKDLVVRPQQHASPIILTVLQGLSRYIRAHGFANDPVLEGYSRDNITAAQLSEHEPDRLES